MEDSTIFSLNQDAACRYFQFEATSLLYERPENSCTLAEFCGLYHKKFGKQYKKADFGLKKAIDIFNAIGPEMIEASFMFPFFSFIARVCSCKPFSSD